MQVVRWRTLLTTIIGSLIIFNLAFIRIAQKTDESIEYKAFMQYFRVRCIAVFNVFKTAMLGLFFIHWRLCFARNPRFLRIFCLGGFILRIF